MFRLKLILGLVLGMWMVASAAIGVEVPELSQVPQNIQPAQHEKLLKRRAALEWEWELLVARVKGHNQNIFGKLGVQRRTEAVARARELGLL